MMYKKVNNKFGKLEILIIIFSTINGTVCNYV